MAQSVRSKVLATILLILIFRPNMLMVPYMYIINLQIVEIPLYLSDGYSSCFYDYIYLYHVIVAGFASLNLIGKWDLLIISPHLSNIGHNRP